MIPSRAYREALIQRPSEKKLKKFWGFVESGLWKLMRQVMIVTTKMGHTTTHKNNEACIGRKTGTNE